MDLENRIFNALAGPGRVVNTVLLDHLGSSLAGHSLGTAAVGELRSLLSLASDTPAGERLAIDPSLARGLSYYTGAIADVDEGDAAEVADAMHPSQQHHVRADIVAAERAAGVRASQSP